MSGRPILLAEDQSDDVYLFQCYHKQCGVHNSLHIVSDGAEVVRYFETSHRLKHPRPVAVFLDLKMPTMGGMEVLEFFKSSSLSGFPSIILSGNEDPRLVTEARQLGADSFLIKPIPKAEFCDLLARIEGVKMDGCAVSAGQRQ